MTASFTKHWILSIPWLGSDRGHGVLCISCFLITSILGSSRLTLAQDRSTENVFSHMPGVHYSERNSVVKHQTWAIVQDSRGVIYVADKDGVKVFNGRSWQVVPTVTGSTIRSLAVSEDDEIFYGAQGDFGKIVLDKNGRLAAVSISADFEFDEATFGNVFATFSSLGGVIFQTPSAVFFWNRKDLITIKAESYFHTSFILDDVFFVREAGVGLKKRVGQSLVLIPGGDVFAETRIYMMEVLDDGTILVGTQEKGMFLIEEDQIRSMPTELDEFQISKSDNSEGLRLYTGTRISSQFLAIGTLGAGLVIINMHGDIIKVLDADSGMPDDVINFVYLGRTGEIWMALDNAGVLGIDVVASVIRYGDGFGIKGHSNFIFRGQDELMVSTGRGLFVLNEPDVVRPPDGKNYLFEEIEGINRPWHVTKTVNGLAISTDEGLRFIGHSDERETRIDCGSEPTFVTFYSSSNQLIAGTKSGLRRVDTTNTACLIAIPGVESEVWSVITTAGNSLWIGTAYDGIFRLVFNTTSLLELSREIEIFSEANGLPSSDIDVMEVGDKPIFVSDRGPYRFIEQSKRFELDRALWPFKEGKTDSLLALTEDHRGNVWMAFPDSLVKAIPKGDGTYSFHTPDALRFKKASTMAILAEDDDVVWFNDGDVLVRYDAKKDVNTRPPYNALVTGVTKYLTDETIFRGNFAGPNGTVASIQSKNRIPELLYEESELSVSYAATSFTFPEEVRYQTRIVGSDSTWSEWTRNTDYRVRSLSAGAYSFQVRAKNSEGRISRTGSYSFVVLPPWYFTWWAYLMYVSVGALLVYSGSKYWLMVRAQQLATEQAKELEKEREFNKALQEANDQLIKANKLKDEFLATTSHELRTPLTSILGFTAVLKDEIPPDAEYREFLDIIEDSGTRLMDTLNSLLDLAKLRAGMMDLNLESCDIYYQCRDGISSLQAAAKRQGLTLRIERPKEPVYVELDVLGFLRIVYNLVGNAIKFTEEGSVTVHIEHDEDLVHMHVSDTGIGIDSKFFPKLFDEFVQESDGAARTHEGFGLGLAITARLVRLMNGTISVESEKGKGSVFTVTLPRIPAPIGRPMRMRSFGLDTEA